MGQDCKETCRGGLHLKIDYSSHYDDSYWQFRKQYRDSQGNVKLYQNPSLDWQGFDGIHSIITKLIPGKTLLDIGAAGGALADRFLREGREAYGVDISKYAIDNCIPTMKGRIALADITDCPETLSTDNIIFPETFDSIIATDLLEHLYIQDLDKTFDWMISKTNRFMLFCVAIVPNQSEEFILNKGEEVPINKEVTAISGHVNVRTPQYWVKFFMNKNLTIRYDLMWYYLMKRERIDWLKSMIQWGAECFYVLEKR